MVTYLGLFLAFVGLLVALIGGTHSSDAIGRRHLAISGWIAGALILTGIIAGFAGAYEVGMQRADLAAQVKTVDKNLGDLRKELSTAKEQRNAKVAEANQLRVRVEELSTQLETEKEKLEVTRRNEMYLRLQIESQAKDGAGENDRPELKKVLSEKVDLDEQRTWKLEKRLFSGGTLELSGFDCSVLVEYGEERQFVRLRPNRARTLLLMSAGPQPFPIQMTRSSGTRCSGSFVVFEPEDSPIAIIAEAVEPPQPPMTEPVTAEAATAAPTEPATSTVPASSTDNGEQTVVSSAPVTPEAPSTDAKAEQSPAPAVTAETPTETPTETPAESTEDQAVMSKVAAAIMSIVGGGAKGEAQKDQPSEAEVAKAQIADAQAADAKAPPVEAPIEARKADTAQEDATGPMISGAPADETITNRPVETTVPVAAETPTAEAAPEKTAEAPSPVAAPEQVVQPSGPVVTEVAAAETAGEQPAEPPAPAAAPAPVAALPTDTVQEQGPKPEPRSEPVAEPESPTPTAETVAAEQGNETPAADSASMPVPTAKLLPSDVPLAALSQEREQEPEQTESAETRTAEFPPVGPDAPPIPTPRNLPQETKAETAPAPTPEQTEADTQQTEAAERQAPEQATTEQQTEVEQQAKIVPVGPYGQGFPPPHRKPNRL